MIRVKVFKNTTLISFERKENLDLNTSKDFKNQMMDILKRPFTNLFVDLEKVEHVDAEGLNTLMAGQRLSEMNQSQLSLFNVKEGVLKSMKKYDLDNYFFFCDRPKPFSDDLLMV
ncbi:STAS domain-containing protein [Carboxylicivirga mesophila]|uniref:STAS domain-containing protein n=2 Tax=Carboxylicivirga TaxID=1628153 RepID=A0A941F763_9BACT|nr:MULTISPECIES: STAS domain-containing protein [Carboxylicivirga]MBR8536905.1 STAS domain-containing protein [Carboxylicivirga sediminis]MBS2212797.1 STAS domain-containing protein [Carboxylicivirga mesophila]